MCHGNAAQGSMICKVKVAQSCPTLCNAMDYGPSGSSVYGILQSRMLEWAVIVFSSNLELNLHF